MNKRQISLAIMAFHLSLSAAARPDTTESNQTIDFTSDHLKLSVSDDGRLVHFIDRASGTDYATPQPIAGILHAGKLEQITRCKREGDVLMLSFGQVPATARVRVTQKPAYLLFEVEDLEGDSVTQFSFLTLSFKLKGQLSDPFAACGLALNLKTNIDELPGPCAGLHAHCYSRFGMKGAQVALIGCPMAQLRTIMQQVVMEAPDLPHSRLGGPWAMDAPINHGSYLFNFGDVSEETVDAWIDTIRRIGFDQLDFHGGGSFRFGDLRLNPKTYPRGVASLKAVIDKLHAAGISAGLHTYSWFMDKSSVYITPKPDPRLGKDAVFTLAADLSETEQTVPVLETTEKMSTTTGFFVSNSTTLQIDDELITYGDVAKASPFGFGKCKRGAHGTKVTPHAKGAKVYHLKELFGLFAPDGDAGLAEELAQKTAELFNDAGFDMIYLDALDGEGTIGGPDAGWHYGSKFAFEIARHLKKPALMEMSTFHHHLWYLRSRYVAWDHPNRAYKLFIDQHCESNDLAARMFLPGHLGWWRVRSGMQSQVEPTYSDDIEYLCCKSLGRGDGLSLIGIDPGTIAKTPAFPRLAEIMRRYESLRRSGKVSEQVRSRLKQPRAEFTLDETGGSPTFRPVQTMRHKIDGSPGGDTWQFENPYARQPARLRVEMLLAAGGEKPAPTRLCDMNSPDEFKARASADAVTTTLTAAGAGPSPDMKALTWRAENKGNKKEGAWASIIRTFDKPLDLTGRQGLSIWVNGDGRGEVLNVQLKCPSNLPTGTGEHYVTIDFKGWRQIRLVETEGDRCGEYQFPYSGSAYALYREEIDYREVASIGLWYNNIPAGGAVECQIGPIEAIPVQPSEMKEPTIECNGRRMKLRCTMSTGQYIEIMDRKCRLFGAEGEELPDPAVEGELLLLEMGTNRLKFEYVSTGPLEPRVQVRVSALGEPLAE